MKKLISGVTAAAMLLTISTGVFACVGKKEVKPAAPSKSKIQGLKLADKSKASSLSADTKAKIKALQDAFTKDVAPLKDQLKTLSADLKTAKAANPVDTTKVKSINDLIASVKKEISDKEKALKSNIEKEILIAQYGADAVAKIEAAQSAFAKDVAPLKDSIKTLEKDLKAALSATTVDKEKVKSIKEQIKTVNKQIADKQKALCQSIEKIKLVAQYGADAVAKIDAAKAAYDKDVAAINEKIKTIKADLKAATSSTTIDKKKVTAIIDQLNAACKELKVKKEALNALIQSIKKTATTTVNKTI
ncbi:MAG: hypothetical protein Q8942_19135 [Bacillota bacterium]|nr:hypothetical protein [Bacillota bacterium]